MAYQPIIIGAANAKAGDNLFTGATKINANFVELYASGHKIPLLLIKAI